MKYLLLKLAEADVIGVTFRSYRQVNVETDSIESPYLLEWVKSQARQQHYDAHAAHYCEHYQLKDKRASSRSGP